MQQGRLLQFYAFEENFEVINFASLEFYRVSLSGFGVAKWRNFRGLCCACETWLLVLRNAVLTVTAAMTGICGGSCSGITGDAAEAGVTLLTVVAKRADHLAPGGLLTGRLSLSLSLQ